MRLVSKNHVILVSNWVLTKYRTSFVESVFWLLDGRLYRLAHADRHTGRQS